MIRVLMADDHTIVREGIRQLLTETADLVMAGEARNGAELIQRIREASWDVLLMDLSMPGRNGIELIRYIKTEAPKLPILILSMHTEDQYAVRAFKAGASGYLTKDSASSQLVAALKKVAAGGVYVSASVAERLALGVMPRAESLTHEILSNREYQIFQMIVGGAKVSEIARMLSLSVKTVSTHKGRILKKMNLRSAADMVRYAIQNHLVDG